MKDKFYLYRQLFFTTFFISICIYVFRVIQPELHYHFKQPSFLANAWFFAEYTMYPGGIAEYISLFLSQLFYFKWIGTLVIILSALIIFILAHKISAFFNLSKSFLFLIYIPIALYISLFNNYYFPFASAFSIIFSYFFTWLFLIFTRRGMNKYLVFFILSLAGYYLGGSGSFIVFSLSVIICSLFLNGFQKSKFLILMILLISISISIPYLAYKFVFDISISRAYFSFIPNLHPLIDYKPTLLFYSNAFYLPLLIISLIVIDKKLRGKTDLEENKILKNTDETDIEDVPATEEVKPLFGPGFKLLFNFILIVFITFSILKKTTNPFLKKVILIDYYGFTEQWDKVVNAALAEPLYNFFININYNRAIEKQGQLLDKFFNYPQLLGKDILFPNKVGSSDIALISSDYYYDLGYMSEALHWAHEAQTVFPYSPRILERMVMTNLVFGNYITAKKYLQLLDDNFLGKKFVAQYMPYVEDTNLIVGNKEIMLKRSFLPKGFIVTDTKSNFQNLLMQNSNNKSAYEHLQLYFILNHSLKELIPYIPEGKKFYHFLPKMLEEAMIVHTMDMNPAQLKKIKLSNEGDQILNDYSRIMKKFNYDKVAARKELTRSIGNTYMYYLMYYKKK